MKHTISRGIFLLFFSFVYIIVLKMFYNISPQLIEQYKFVVTFFYVLIFFIEGFQTNTVSDSFVQGFIGSLFGTFLMFLGIYQINFNNNTILDLVNMLDAWNLPLIGVFQPKAIGQDLIQVFAFHYLTIMGLIFTTMIGSFTSKIFLKFRKAI